MKTILIVDDNAINRAILSELLSDDYLILEAENGKTALDILNDQRINIDAVMLDLVMPVMDGYEFLEVVQNNPVYKDTPIIVTTVEGNSNNEKRALKLGAWDFVSKPYDEEIIKFRLRNAIDRSQLSAFKQLKYLAEYDTLTGIFNKSNFFKATRKMILQYPEEKFAFIRYDIDRFQLINSFFGVEEGNRLLKYMAVNIKDFVEKQSVGTFGRIEADIFGLCLPYDESNIISFLEASREMLAEYNINYYIVPSFGIYIIDDMNIPMDIVNDRAALATKKCKGNYIGYYSFYDDQMSEIIIKEQEITNNMNTALAEEQFEVYIQPKYDLRTNMPVGGEALVRWIKPDKKMVSPGDFVPIFERNGFICKLDYYVWEKVCKLIRTWIDQGKPCYPVSVNVSRVNLYNPQIVDIIYELTEKYNIPQKLLHLELTESAYMDNPIAMCEAMEKLQSKGFIILMDDFGSGYSSLNVLKDISVDVLKIDMKFLSKTDIPSRGQNIIASVIRMAKWLNLPVVAEGVETSTQVEFLRSIGCEFVQGYYFAKPMPIAEYEELIASYVVFGGGIKEITNAGSDTIWLPGSQMDILFNNELQPAAIYEFDGNNNVQLLRVNKPFYEIIGYENAAFNSRCLIDNVNQEYKETVLDTLRKVVETKESAECEYIRRQKNGNSVWISNKLKYIDEVGEKHLILGTLTDITLQKEISIELNKYRKALLENHEGPYKMLVVDDLELSRVMINEIFKDNYIILEAPNGKAALEILENNTVDIILLDLKMPIMDGTEFLEYRNSNRRLTDIPVVVITSDDSEEEQKRALAYGANDYIVKPFVKETVQRRIINVMESNAKLVKKVKAYEANKS